MFCTKCGSPVSEKQLFCGKCGKAVTPVINAANSRSAQEQVGALSPASVSASSRMGATANVFRATGDAPSSKASRRFARKPSSKLAAAAASCLIVAGLVVGSAAGYAFNAADGSRTHQQGKAIPTQVVNSGHTQEQVSVGARNEVEKYSWEELATISDAIAVAKSEGEALKIAKDFNLVGSSGKLDGTQTKTVKLSSGAVAQAQIIGFSHDVRDGGGKAGITFMFKDCIAEHQLNASGTTSGGWLDSDLRRWMDGELFYSLPEDLRNSIVSVCKSANNEGKADSRSSVTTVSDLLWVPSYTELVGSVDMDSYERAYERIPASRESEFQTYFDIWNAEGSQYKLYRDCKVKMARPNSALVKHLPSGAAANWWGRSASPGEWDRALSVTSKGEARKSTATPSEWLGVAPCFCVGRFGCGEARDTVSDYVDNSVTYVHPVDVNYAYVNEDNSTKINVTYLDKSTNTTNVTNNNTINNTTNNVDNSVDVDVDTDVDTSVDVGDDYQSSPIPEDEGSEWQNGDQENSDSCEGEDENNDNGGDLKRRWVEPGHDSDDDGEADEKTDEESVDADSSKPDGSGEWKDDADEHDDADESDAADDGNGSDWDADRDSDDGEERDASIDKPAVISADDQQTLTGIIEVRHVGDHDATMLVLPAPVTVSDATNGKVTSDRIGLDSSFSKYEGKRVTLRCSLGVNPDGQVAPNGTTRIYAKGGAQIVSVAGANDELL